MLIEVFLVQNNHVSLKTYIRVNLLSTCALLIWNQKEVDNEGSKIPLKTLDCLTSCIK